MTEEKKRTCPVTVYRGTGLASMVPARCGHDGKHEGVYTARSGKRWRVFLCTRHKNLALKDPKIGVTSRAISEDSYPYVDTGTWEPIEPKKD